MIRWGFIGCGDVVQKKSGKPFQLEGESEVVAVMCRTIAHAKAYAEEHHIPYFYDDGDALIANEQVDAVYIATPPSTHMEYAKKAIAAGKPVYVEKPMGINKKECEEVLALSKEKQVPLFVAFYRRGLPMFQEIKQRLANGEIGEIRSLTIKQYTKAPQNDSGWRRDPSISGGGLFHDLACHTLDVLDYIMGPIETGSGFHDNQKQQFNCDDIVTASFRFKSGVLGTSIWCFDVAENLDEVEIIGNKGKFSFPVFGNKLSIIKEDKETLIEFTHPAFIQEPLIHNMIHALNHGIQPLSTGDSAFRTVEIMDAFLGK